MRRLALLVLLSVALALAGCTQPSSDTTPEDSPEPETVEYLVSPGDIPEELQSVNATFQAVYVEDANDLGPCYRDIYYGAYRATPTPIADPAGACHRSEAVTLDLAGIDGERSLGRFPVPDGAVGHAFLVTDVSATYENGTTTTAIQYRDGAALFESAERPNGTYGFTVGLDTASDAPAWDYEPTWDRYTPDE